MVWVYKTELKSLKSLDADKIDWFPSLQRPNSSNTGDSLIHSNLSYRQMGGSYGPTVRR